MVFDHFKYGVDGAPKLGIVKNSSVVSRSYGTLADIRASRAMDKNKVFDLYYILIQFKN